MDGPKIIKGREAPIPRARYNFDALVHGDAIVVASPKSAIEMFRRWRMRDPRARNHLRLVASGKRGEEHLLFYVDTQAPSPLEIRRRSVPSAMPSERFGTVTKTVPAPQPQRDPDEI